MLRSATGVTFKDDKILLIKRGEKVQSSPGKWFFPGGRAEGDETPEENIIREFKEEVGLIFTPEKVIHEFAGLNRHLDEVIRTRFIGKSTGEIIIQEEEVDDHGWFTYEEALNLEIAFEGVEHILHLRKNNLI